MPKPSPDVKGKLELMHLVEQLKVQKRTGWVRQGVKGPESIADHMYRMAVLSLLSEEDQELDIGRCVQMAVVHDLAEASVGDITPFDGISKADKQKMETDAMNNMTQNLLNPALPASKRIHALFHEYEEGRTREAKFVKDLDRIEMALQASEYEKAQGHKGLQPFFESSIPKIQHPEVQRWAEELMLERQAANTNNPSYKHVSTASTEPAESPSSSQSTDLPHPPSGLLQLPANAVNVTDPDEEIFLLYTQLAASQKDEAIVDSLGFVDSKTGLLRISLEIPKTRSLPLEHTEPVEPNINAKGRASSTARKRMSSTARSSKNNSQADIVEVEIQQDLSGLRNRSGDTGSIVWSASIELAKLLLRQSHLEPKAALLHPDLLKSAKILELGSGTGVLPILLAPLVGLWTTTDIEQCLPLIRKNITRNVGRAGSAEINVQQLDWTWSKKQMQRIFPAEDGIYDLMVAVDCLYNEAMVLPFVNTMNTITAKAVMVVSELRTPDVQRLFLETWLGSGAWEVWRICKATPGDSATDMTDAALLDNKHVVWIGWKA